MEQSKLRINLILMALVITDIVLAAWGFFLPELWFKVFHGVPYNDPQGFLPRCAANWTAFLLLQIIALIRWPKEPFWLVMVCGARFSDVLTDFTYYWFCSDITWFGRGALLSAGPLNFLVGWYLLSAYKKMR